MDAKTRNTARSIGTYIRRRREASGLTQDDVGERLGIGGEAVSRMERGLTIPTIIRLLDLAEIFGCPVEDLLREASSRAIDQAGRVEVLLDALSADDREMVTDVVRLLCDRLHSR